MEFFVYGTLTDPHIAAGVLDADAFGADATLYGLERREGEYPTLVPGDSAEGVVLHTDEVAALDAYEGVDDGLYVRVGVPAEDGAVQAYVGDPERLGVGADWPEEFSETAVQAYVNEHCFLQRE